MIGLSLSKSFSLKEASSPRNKLVKQAKRRWSYHNHWQIEVFNPVPTNYNLKWFNLHMTTLSRRILVHKPFHQKWRCSIKVIEMDVLKEYCAINAVEKGTMPTDVPQNNEARMSMLRECVLYVVKKGTIPMDVQQSVRRLDSMILDYTVSSVEKMDTLPVGVKK